VTPKTTHIDIIAAWMNAPLEERTKAIDSIGLMPLLAALPPNWLPVLEQWIADRQQPLVPAAVPTDPDLVIPRDLTIPEFLRRTSLSSSTDITREDKQLPTPEGGAA
jgi:hypothetical protein